MAKKNENKKRDSGTGSSPKGVKKSIQNLNKGKKRDTDDTGPRDKK